jgi:topoisomerase IV subunit A
MQALSHFFSDLAISARWLKDGGLSDLKSFKAETGLTWTDTAGREFSLTGKEYADWRGNRADAGRLAPKGFPRTNRFSATVSGRKTEEES